MDNKAGQMKKISIAIPALNESQGRERRINAILKDELKRIGYEVQVLVVDNGSDGGTGEQRQGHLVMSQAIFVNFARSIGPFVF